MQKSQDAFSAGQHVTVRDERWTILKRSDFGSTSLLTLRGAAHTNRDAVQAVLTDVDEVRPVTASTRLRQRARRVTLRAACHAIATTASWEEPWTATAAAIDLHHFQLEPAMAAVSGATRILIADGVGLGKTIEAGLIVSELAARGLADRVLILTPAAIREQWAEEMTTRFQLRFSIFDQPSILAAAASLPPDVNPWQAAAHIISSIDLVKRDEVRTAIEGAAFDLLIVDEAHHLTPASDRGAFVKALATRIPWVVLITATPHSGDEEAHTFLTSIGSIGDDSLTIFHRTNVHDRGRRRSRLLLVSATEPETALLSATREYAHALARHRDSGARLVGSIIARRAASSARAVRSTLDRRVALLMASRPFEQQRALPWEELDHTNDDVSDATLAVAGLQDAAHEIAWLERLSRLAANAEAHWSKLTVIERLLRRTSEPVLVFSEYRDVALQIADALQRGTSVVSLHGGLSPRERSAAVAAFNGGRARVLVATDAAGEGLNLQSRCRLVVNVELPWSPLRLEQRIGRVDRMGQTRRVHSIQLAHRDSYEGTVIARLERRRAAARRPRQSARLGEMNVHATFARRLLTLASSVTDEGVYTPRGTGSTLTLVFSLRLTDSRGTLVERNVIAMRLNWPMRRPLARQSLRALVAHPCVQELLTHESNLRVARARRQMDHVRPAIEARLQGLRQRLARHTATRKWQPSLFDRRAESAALQGCDNDARAIASLQRRLAAVRQMQSLRADTPRLVAAWIS